MLFVVFEKVLVTILRVLAVLFKMFHGEQPLLSWYLISLLLLIPYIICKKSYGHFHVQMADWLTFVKMNMDSDCLTAKSPSSTRED